MYTFLMFFSLLFKEKNLNPFDLHMHPVNDQICQAVKSRRRPVARRCWVTGKALNADGRTFGAQGFRGKCVMSPSQATVRNFVKENACQCVLGKETRPLMEQGGVWLMLPLLVLCSLSRVSPPP